MNLICRLINRSGLRISHSKVFSSERTLYLICVTKFNSHYIISFIIMLFILGSLKSTLIPEFLTVDQGKNDNSKPRIWLKNVNVSLFLKKR